MAAANDPDGKVTVWSIKHPLNRLFSDVAFAKEPDGKITDCSERQFRNAPCIPVVTLPMFTMVICSTHEQVISEYVVREVHAAAFI